MPPTIEGYLETGPVALHYHRTRGGPRSIVLAHGFSDNGRCWASLFQVLAHEYDVIAFDAPGHGRSSAPPGPWTIDDQANALIALVIRLELERPILMGHSMGGVATFWAAIAEPDLAAATIFEDSAIPRGEPTGPQDRNQARAMRDGMRTWAASLKERSVDDLVTLARKQSPDWPEADLRPWAESKLELDLDAIARFSMQGNKDLGEHLSQLRCPALFLMADAEEAERIRQRKVVSSVPHGEVVHVEGAGHNVRRDRHGQTVAILSDFLGRLAPH